MLQQLLCCCGDIEPYQSQWIIRFRFTNYVPVGTTSYQVQCGGTQLTPFPQHPDIPYLALPSGYTEQIDYLSPIIAPGHTAEPTLSLEDIESYQNGGYLDPQDYGIPCGLQPPQGVTANPVQLTRPGWTVYLCPYPALEGPSVTEFIGAAKIYWPQIYGPRNYSTADSIYPCSWTGAPVAEPYTSHRINREWWQYRDSNPENPLYTIKGGCDSGFCYSYVYVRLRINRRFQTYYTYDQYFEDMPDDFASLHITYNLPIEIVGPGNIYLDQNQATPAYVNGSAGYPIAMDAETYLLPTFNFANDPIYTDDGNGTLTAAGAYEIEYTKTQYITRSGFPVNPPGNYAFQGAEALNGPVEVIRRTNFGMQPHYLW